jgi:prepilin-type N-terminal cleavage/methylation domain-containing protein
MTTTPFARRIQPGRPAAFTLIEMLMVIGIIALLAALLVGATSHLGETKARSLVKTELENVKTAIEAYHKKYGFYPQGNPGNPAKPPLYYELTGTQLTPPVANGQFGVKGIVNEVGREGENFFKNLGVEGKSYRDIDPPNGVFVLTVPYKGPDGDINPWRYVSKNPTNNTETYDLWAEIQVGNKKIVIGNWKE